MKPIIRVRGLGKQYRIGARSAGYATLRESLMESLNKPFGWLRRNGRTAENTIWALKDVNFDVQPGEVVGIIGRNGAGKSTLLKILSRITEPTEGEVDLHGRVASLLEVGTGFHPELTGRDNVFLNGAILGMRRAEINRKFDDIVQFAEVEKFIDTPVKHYSSGMYTRLAFAVAAHLDPEILIVDEVLAVGDAAFQKKCLGKMGEVAGAGRTVLFVSHNMATIQALCRRAVLLQSGRTAAIGRTDTVLHKYVSSAGSSYRAPSGGKLPRILEAELLPFSDERESELLMNVLIQSDRVAQLAVDVRLSDSSGVSVAFGSLGSLSPSQLVKVEHGLTRIVLRHDIGLLASGSYLISLDIQFPFVAYLDRAENCLAFETHQRPAKPDGRRLEQQWRYGSWELPTEATSISHEANGHSSSSAKPEQL
jgi:lipopolysaccharide transport system ATP-binding protein